VYLSEAGGLLNASGLFAMEAAGVPCMIASIPGFAIGTSARIHLDVATTRPLRIEGRHAYLADGPRLGVEADPAVLGRWRRDPLAVATPSTGGTR
jgi:L-alanine-DL-glutamate epimerase-like enolase superfamily enzyme